MTTADVRGPDGHGDMPRRFALDDIPEEQRDAIRRYILVDHERVDAALRAQDAGALEELDDFIRLVSYGMFQLPSFRGVAYRGATLSADVASRYEPGNVVFERSFVAATADPARRYPGNTTFVIASINGRDVSALSDAPEEQEVMFFAGTRFKVLAIERDVSSGEQYIYLAEIPEPALFQGYTGG